MVSFLNRYRSAVWNDNSVPHRSTISHNNIDLHPLIYLLFFSPVFLSCLIMVMWFDPWNDTYSNLYYKPDFCHDLDDYFYEGNDILPDDNHFVNIKNINGEEDKNNNKENGNNLVVKWNEDDDNFTFYEDHQEENSGYLTESNSSEAESTNSNDSVSISIDRKIGAEISDHVQIDSEINIYDPEILDRSEFDKTMEIIKRARNLNKILSDGLYSVYPILDGDYKLIIKNNKNGQLGEVPYEHSSQDFINLFKELGTNTQSEKNLSDSVETITQEKFN